MSSGIIGTTKQSSNRDVAEHTKRDRYLSLTSYEPMSLHNRGDTLRTERKRSDVVQGRAKRVSVLAAELVINQIS